MLTCDVVLWCDPARRGIGRKAILINGNVPAANFLRLPKARIPPDTNQRLLEYSRT